MLEWLKYKKRLQSVRTELVEMCKTLRPIIEKKKTSPDLLVVARATDLLGRVLVSVIDSLPGKS
jgi:hypothetical protein